MKYLLGIFTILLLISCSNEDRVVDNSIISFDLYLADSISNDFSLYDYPSMELKKEGVLSSHDISLNTPIRNIREYLNKLYIMVPGDDKMIVYDRLADSIVKVNNLNTGSGPSDITFANASDAFISFNNAPYTFVYDLVFNEVTRGVDGKGFARSISTFGRNVYIANFGSSTVGVLDTRDFIKVKDIEVSPLPILTGVTESNEILVISLGGNKNPENGELGETTASFINPESNTLRNSVVLGNFVKSPTEMIPIDIALTPLDFAFMITNLGLIRLDTRNNASLYDIDDVSTYKQVEYSAQDDTILVLNNKNSGPTLVQFSELEANILNEYSLPQNVNHFHLSY